LHDLAEHLVTDDQVWPAFRGADVPARSLLSIGATDADTDHFELDLIRLDDIRFRTIYEL
jgi:hypothetical protein